jgi:hypothetical protein
MRVYRNRSDPSSVPAVAFSSANPIYLLDEPRPNFKEREMKIPGLGAAALLIAGAFVTPASAAELEGIAETTTFREYPITGVPLLDSFYFRFIEHDHHIEAIGVKPASPIPDPCYECAEVPPGLMEVSFHDEGRDDNYYFRISHAELPANVLRHRISGYCNKTCTELLDPHPRDSVFVITGFTFYFIGGDQRLNRVGLWEDNGQLVVHFRDDDGKELFRYDLEYVYLPPAMIPIRGHVEGVNARGGVSVPIDLGPVAMGPTVLRGFDLVFRPGDKDQNIWEIGVRTPGKTIEVFFSSDEHAENWGQFDWGVDWGALSRIPVFDPGPPRR